MVSPSCTPVAFDLFYKISPFQKIFESFSPKIYADSFFTKTHKEKQRQFIDIQQCIKINVTLVAGAAQ